MNPSDTPDHEKVEKNPQQEGPVAPRGTSTMNPTDAYPQEKIDKKPEQGSAMGNPSDFPVQKKVRMNLEQETAPVAKGQSMTPPPKAPRQEKIPAQDITPIYKGPATMAEKTGREAVPVRRTPTSANPADDPGHEKVARRPVEGAAPVFTRHHRQERHARGGCCQGSNDCITAWCGTIEYLRWTVLILAVIIFCLILALVLADIDHRICCSTHGDINCPLRHAEPNMRGAKTDRTPCPNRWLQYNGRCYYFSSENKTWGLGKIFCSLHQATLAVILEPLQMEILEQYNGDKQYWIGLARGEYVWNWEGGFPYSSELIPLVDHNYTMNCAYMEKNIAKSANCSSLKPWICMKKSLRILTDH